MAMQIFPTPKLNKKQSEEFLKMVEAKVDIPSYKTADKKLLRKARQKAAARAKLGS